MANDPIDKFLEIGSGFDWITPVWAFIQDIRHGSAFQINLPLACGHSAGEIERILKAWGIYVWGMMIVGETITFTVRKTQAHYAMDLLKRWGIPIDGHSQLPKRTRKRKSGGWWATLKGLW